MGFNMLFSIIFGTNQLTGGLVPVSGFFAYFSVLHKRNIKQNPNGINLWESYFWNKCDPEDLERTSRNKRGVHEAGGAPTPWARPPASWLPCGVLDFNSKSSRLRLFQE